MSDEKEIVQIAMTEEELSAKLKEAELKGANILYGELIGFQMKALEVFAEQFRPQDATFENFLGYVLHTMQVDFNKRYANKEILKEGEKDEESGEKDDGKPEEVPSEAKEGEEPSEAGHQDVREGSEGRQEANKECA